MNKQQLNNLVNQYLESRSEQTFNEIYAEVIGKVSGKLETIGKSIRADRHEALALYEDTLMKCIEKFDGKSDFENFFNLSVRNRRTDLLRHKNYLTENEALEPKQEDEKAATFELADPFRLEDYATRTKKADQLQLIDSLLNGADETTTAIVETFLAHPNPTATAIAKQIGCHHSKVLRALHRLAANFDPKQYGNYSDYLVAL